MSTTAAPTFTYCIDTFGPNPDAPSTNLIVPGPAGLSRSAALDYLTERLRDMAGGPTVAPPEGWSEWGPFAASVLDQAEGNPTVGQSAKATDREGVWVTAYGGSELPKRNPDDARALLVDALTDLLTAHGGRLDAVRPLIPAALTMAASHYEAEQDGATVTDAGAERLPSVADVDRPDDTRQIVVFPDGETFNEVGGCIVATIPTAWEIEDAEDALRQGFEGQLLTDLLASPGSADDDHPEPGFTLSIELGNAGMQSAYDVGEALERIGGDLVNGTATDEGRVRDGNGNTVGRWTLTLGDDFPGTCADCGTGNLDPDLQRDGEDFLLCDDCRDQREAPADVTPIESTINRRELAQELLRAGHMIAADNVRYGCHVGNTSATLEEIASYHGGSEVDDDGAAGIIRRAISAATKEAMADQADAGEQV
jgi:hypothetical protein